MNTISNYDVKSKHEISTAKSKTYLCQSSSLLLLCLNVELFQWRTSHGTMYDPH